MLRLSIPVRIAVVGALAVVANACGTAAFAPARLDPPVVRVQDEPAEPAASRDLDSAPDLGRVVAFTFHRPRGCGDRARIARDIEGRTCQEEDRLEVLVSPDGKHVSRLVGTGPARNPYPEDLVRQWRICPSRPHALLKSLDDVFVPWSNPEGGPCWLYRPTDRKVAEEIARKAGFRHLKGLHPYVADSVRQLVLKAREEGIDLKVISGLRPHTVRKVWVTKTVKVKGKKVKKKVAKTTHRRTWHTWGVGIDVNLGHRKDLSSATAAFVSGGTERKQWMRVGEIGESLGLKWLGLYDANEIFHFEWRPGLPGLPKGAVHSKLSSLKARGGLEAVWQVFARDPKKRGLFSHLEDAP